MEPLQLLWFGLVGVLLAGYGVLDGFDLGVGILHLIVKKDDIAALASAAGKKPGDRGAAGLAEQSNGCRDGQAALFAGPSGQSPYPSALPCNREPFRS